MTAVAACGQEVTFMVQDDAAVGLDGLNVVFDDERVVSDAGIVLVATLAGRLGIEDLARGVVRLRQDRAGAANAGRKVMALMFAMLLGADSIDDCDAREPAARAGCSVGGCPLPRRWGRSYGHSPSGMSVNSTSCSVTRSRGRGAQAPMNGQELLTTTEVAQALRATDQTIRNWIERGRLPAVRVGRRYLIARSELARLRAGQGIPAGESPWDHTQPAIPLARVGTASGWWTDGR